MKKTLFTKFKLVALSLTFFLACTANKPKSTKRSSSKNPKTPSTLKQSSFTGNLISHMAQLQSEAKITERKITQVCYLSASCLNKRQFGQFIEPSPYQTNKKTKAPFLLAIPGKMGLTEKLLELLHNFTAFDYKILAIDLYGLTHGHSEAEIKDESLADSLYARVEEKNQQITTNGHIQIKEAVKWLGRKDSKRAIVILSWDIAIHPLKTFLSLRQEINQIKGLVNYYGDLKVLTDLSGAYKLERMLHILPSNGSHLPKSYSERTKNLLKNIIKQNLSSQSDLNNRFQIDIRSAQHGFMEPGRSSKYNDLETAVAIEKTLLLLKEFTPTN